jgi:hypothetical protein
VITNASFQNGMASPAIDAVSFAWTDLAQLINHLVARLATDPEGIVQTERQAQFGLYYRYAEIWAEEARIRATPTLISLGGVAPSDVADTTGMAWRKAV